jgi:imidazolonepropionase-like amidohydrolase
MRLTLLATALLSIGLTAIAEAAQPKPVPVWTPSAKAPDQLLTPLEIQRHDLFIKLAQSASSCSGAPLSEKCVPGGIDIVFFGTTSTEMWWWPDRGMEVWEEFFGSRKAVNFGSQGTRFESLLWRMRNGELDGYQAKLVVMQTLGPTGRVGGVELTAAHVPIIAEIRARQPEAKILLFDAPRAGWTDADANAKAHAGIVDNQTVFYAGLGERFITDRDGYKAWAAALEPWLERFGLQPVEPVRTGIADRTPVVAPPTPGSSTTQSAVSGRFVIRGVRLFDGEGVSERRNVVVSDGRVLQIGGAELLPEGIEVIDGEGRTLLPGLIDSHVHLAADPEQALSQSLSLGVTTVIDMFSTGEVFSALKHFEREDSPALADLRTAGTGATAPGGWPSSQTAYATISNPAQAEAFVQARLSEGSDFIKVFYDDLSRSGAPRPTISEETLGALIDAAKTHGVVSVVHIATETEARKAIAAGGDGLAHMFIGDWVSADFGEFAASHDAFVIPTLSVLRCRELSVPKAAADERLAPFLPRQARRLGALNPLGRMPCAAVQPALKQLIAAGVPILAGSDEPIPGSTFGASLHGELSLLVENGLSPLQALIAATSAPADAFRLVDRGRIRPGLRADLLLVEGNPTRDILSTRNIVAVWKRGEQASRRRYD